MKKGIKNKALKFEKVKLKLSFCNHRTSEKQLYIAKECWAHSVGGFYYKKHSIFKRPFDRFIVKLREAGILNEIIRKYTDSNNPPKISAPNSNPVILTLAHYEVPMVLLTILLVLDFFVFLVELLGKYSL